MKSNFCIATEQERYRYKSKVIVTGVNSDSEGMYEIWQEGIHEPIQIGLGDRYIAQWIVNTVFGF